MELGIWPPYVIFYIEAMNFSTTSALLSVETIYGHLNSAKIDASSSNISQQEILDSLQNIINHAAVLSRYFWAVKDSEHHKKRAEFLRKKFCVTEESPLRSRDLRNQIEHFDENLDNYIRDGIVGNIVPFYVGKEPMQTGVRTHVFRAFYIDTGVFEILGKKYEIQPIVDEFYRIHEILASAVGNGYKL